MSGKNDNVLLVNSLSKYQIIKLRFYKEICESKREQLKHNTLSQMQLY